LELMTESPRQLIAWTITMVALAVAAVAALYFALHALVLIYVAVLIAMGFSPLVRAIEHQQLVPVGTRRLPRWLAILVVYLLIVGLAVGVAAMVIPPLSDQARDLWRNLPSHVDRAQDFLVERGLLTHRVTLEEAVRQVPGRSASAVGTVATAVGSVASAVIAFVTVLILAFYLLVDSAALFAGFARLFPLPRRPKVIELSREISEKVSAWMLGQAILAGTIGASSAIGLYLIGVPYFYVLALVSAVGETIPVVGPILAAIPATIAAFTISPKAGLAVIIFFVVQQQTENHLLVPKIMARQVGVSPVVVIVALLIGGSLFGVLGAVLAVPTAAILQVVLQELLDERDRLADAPPSGPRATVRRVGP
jgi:predicted PurR-regulated permease PerM